ncbi:MAG: cysteine-rich KTR domain-containing protein [Peptococcaceae bacterium]
MDLYKNYEKIEEWIVCSVCNNKIRLKIRKDTERNLLYVIGRNINKYRRFLCDKLHKFT